MFDETHIIRLLQVIISKVDIRTQQRAFKCAQSLIETHQKLIVQIMTSQSPILNEFTTSIYECEQIMIRAIQHKQYALLIACVKMLYTILRVTLSTRRNEVDVDVQIFLKMKELGYRVAEQITKVDVVLIHQDKHLNQSNKYKVCKMRVIAVLCTNSDSIVTRIVKDQVEFLFIIRRMGL